eukprot:3090716-Alexandrium_andersonii.AAC.1
MLEEHGLAARRRNCSRARARRLAAGARRSEERWWRLEGALRAAGGPRAAQADARAPTRPLSGGG